jgi:serine/threonine-protein kinase
MASARRLMLLGFRHEDVAPAFAAEIEQGKEERAAAHRAGPSFLERGLKYVSVGGAVTLGAGIGLVMLDVLTARHGLGVTGMLGSAGMFLGGTASILSTIGYVALRERYRDVDSEFWSKFWNSRIGRAAFSVAKRFLGRRMPESAVTYRATELALGMAAEQLYERLPREQRHALADLPVVLRRLQDDAHALRRRYDELQEALVAAGESATSGAYAEVRAMRDQVHARLGEAVGALETTRLNLLRLHAGSGSVEGLTTHLGLAADVSDEVERLIAAHEEIERSLKYPRIPAATPA